MAGVAESEDVLVTEVEVPVLIITEFDVMPGVTAGFDTVILVVEVDDGETQFPLSFAIPSDDVKRICARLTSVAATVRPLHIQARMNGLSAEKEILVP